MPTITVADITLAYAEYGPADGLPIMLLHAFPLRGQMWDAQAQALRDESGCHVVVPDLRGFGTSSAPAGPYLMEQMANDVLALADALGWQRFVLGGISMGGYVAFALARQAAERLQGLILADTKATADTDEGRAGRESMAQQAEREGLASIADVMLPRLLSHATLHDAARTDAVRAMITSNTPAGVAGAARGMALRPDSTDLLPTITCPTLVMVGELDTITPIHEARLLFERIPDAKLAIIRDAAHLSNLDGSGEFNDALVDFLRTNATLFRDI